MDIKTVLFWLLLAAMAIPSFYFGFEKFLNRKEKVDLFRRMGYPGWFMKIVGLCEMGCSIGLLFTWTRMISIGLMAFILISAAVSHFRIKDQFQSSMTPVYVLIHLAAIFVFTFFI